MTQLYRLSVFLLITLLMATPGYAGGNPTSRLASLLADIETFSAGFHQQISDEDQNLLQETKGHLLVKRPGKILWQVTEPWEQSIISNGKTLWHYDADLEQVVIQSALTVNETPTILLSGEIESIQELYSVSEEISGQGSERFLLIPKGEGSLFETLSVEFTLGELHKISFSDSLGQQTSLDFSDIVVNSEIKESQFTFVPPEGIDVLIDEH